MIITSKDRICIEEDFKIEAGPGAGKTEFLVNHIKNILQNSNRLSCARKVACITYTNTAVETILNRIGKGVSDRVEVSTIHSFLYRNVIKPYCAFLPTEYELCSRKVNGHDESYISNRYIREWFENEDLGALRHPNTKNQILNMPAYNQALQNWLLSMQCVRKDGSVSFECDNSKAVGNDKASNTQLRINANNLRILSSKIIGIKKIYWRKGRLDHNDVLFFSSVLIEKYPFILDILRAKFAYMFIDEYQDTNPIQAHIVNEMRKDETIIGVIGDKAQSIYSFQGADPTLFDSYEVDDNNIHTICSNHRSTNQIVTLLNKIRDDINQNSCENIDDIETILYVGERNEAYKKACELCSGNTVVSLSRDNISSNAMKKEIEGNDLDRKLLERYSEQDSNSQRRRFLISFVQAIELSINGKYKEAVKGIEWMFKEEENSKKTALYSLIKMLNVHSQYCDYNLMKFYNVVCSTIGANLSGFRKGAAKEFYENTLYKSIAICINIVEDISSHITIHKAKGSEYENVMIVDNKNTKALLLDPNLDKNEEHRIIYVGMSRARRRLFIQMDQLEVEEERQIQEKLSDLMIVRLM
ncbi:UvrD-helicase domain-containing protein [Acetobacterium carbinolicum]|uniref:UvrD-helicase domain-containing protein n=1 Tax=Acetobacterium carbinolicum TaxID=52690 RepID=UPI0039C8ED22